MLISVKRAMDSDNVVPIGNVGHAKPPVPASMDLRDLSIMPLDVVAMLNSDTWGIASPEERGAAVSLWAKAWHQVPASSLPNDERFLAAAAGYGRDLDSWARVRETALRGFVLCSDGRLYHRVVAMHAMHQWKSHLARVKGGKVTSSLRQRIKNASISSSAEAELQLSSSSASGKERNGEGEERDGDVTPSNPTASANGEGLSPGNHSQEPAVVSALVLRTSDAPLGSSAQGEGLKESPSPIDKRKHKGRSSQSPRAVYRLPESWVLSDIDRSYAERLGMPTAQVAFEATKFHGYFALGKGRQKMRTAGGWRSTWQNWVARELERRGATTTKTGREDSRPMRTRNVKQAKDMMGDDE